MIRQDIIDACNKSAYIRYLNLEFVKLEREEAIGRIPFTEDIHNPYGSVHGGCLYTLADTVAGSLACMCGKFCTTVDGSMNYFAPAMDTEYVYCYAKLVREGGSLVNVSIEIKDDDGKLLDNGSFNYFKLNSAPVS